MQNIKLYILFIVLIITSILPIKSQNNYSNIDSIKNDIKNSNNKEQIDLYNKLSREYWYISTDTSLIYANKALDIAKKNKDKLGQSDAYNRIANSYYFAKNYSKALIFYQKSLTIRKEFKDYSRISGIYNNIALLYQSQNDIETSREFFVKALNSSINSGVKTDIIEFTQILGSSYKRSNEYKKAIEYYLSALNLAKEINNKERIAFLDNSLGSTYQSISSYDIAIEYFFDALNIYQKIENKNGLSIVYNSIGIIYQNLGEQEKALDFFNKSLIIDIELNNKFGESAALNNIGTVYDELNKKTKALEYYQKALILNTKLKDDDGISTAHNNIGLVNYSLGNYDLALRSYYKAIELNKKLNNKHSIANTYNNLSDLLISQKKYSEAEKYLNDAQNIAKEISAQEILQENYLFLSKLYEKQNMHKEALKYYKLYNNITHNIYADKGKRRITEIQIKYETENIEKENELLKKDSKINLLELKKQKNLKRIWIIFSILIIFLTTLIYSRFHLKRKVNSILQSKNQELELSNSKLLESETNLKELNTTKDKFFSIIAHDLKNPFQALLGISELFYINAGKLSEEESIEYSKSIFDSSQKLFNLLENLLQWSQSQLGSINYSPKNIHINEIVYNAISLLEMSAKEKNISINNKITVDCTAFADKNIVSLVVRNLLSNAIKFSYRNSEINIYSIVNENNIVIAIRDYGKGILQENINKLFNVELSYSTKGTANEQGTGLGLILCKELVENSGGKIWVENNKEKGSTFKFSLPIS